MDSIMLPALMALQTIALGAGLWLMGRRIGALRAEVAQLRQALEDRRGVRKAAAAGAVTAPAPRVEPPSARAARVWRLAPASASVKPKLALPYAPIALTAITLAPVFALLFGAPVIYSSVAGIGLGAATLLAALRPAWKRAAWIGAAAATAWAFLAFVFDAPAQHPMLFSTAAALAAACGLCYAHLRDPAPGGALALAMGVAALALGALTGMIGAPGLAFIFILTAGALVGATNLRLEPLHAGSFVAALTGLLVFSGQPAAALWFTPAAALVGVLFLGIAIVRVPQLGARGVLIAGTGTLAPIAAILGLYTSQHGLAERAAAAGALLMLALAIAAMLGLAAARRPGGLTALKLAAWVMTGGIFVCVIGAAAIAAPAPLAAALVMAGALALSARDWRMPASLQSVLAGAAALASAWLAWISAAQVLGEAAAMPAWSAAALGCGAPAALGAVAAFTMRRREQVIAAGWFEMIAAACGLGIISLGLRLGFAGGAPLLHPIGGLEASAHVSAWLMAGLLIGARERRARVSLRGAMITMLTFAAFLAGLAALGAWALHATNAPVSELANVNPLALAAPALLFGVHWRYWRARGARVRTRVSLGVAAFLAAGAVTLAIVQIRAGAGDSDWMSASIGAVAFTLALVVNLAPGVVRTAPSARA